ELFRAAGWKRDEVVVANKLWWEFWPEQRPAEELDASLERMGLDYLDLEYSEEPPAGLPLDELVGMVGDLIASGKLRAWGVLNWEPELLKEASRVASATGVPQPVAAQLPYSLAYPQHVESGAMVEALDRAGASVVASSVLAGGALSGKYKAGGTGRLTGTPDSPLRERSLRVGELLSRRADALGTTPCRLA